ncbi:hypothetical protein [Devosia sp. 1566]|uniref:hypothetical protein n=1 Tax=Devosia sp. 1566 TaxID=2499144 RepID=UPI000FDC4088|nr:hypothetical protein [Devosia sp. 1566]
MTHTDYTAPAELFLGRDHQTAFEQGAKRFRTAAQAIRFAVEEAAPVSLHGALLQVGTKAYRKHELTQLYRSADFPLPRKH